VLTWVVQTPGSFQAPGGRTLWGFLFVDFTLQFSTGFMNVQPSFYLRRGPSAPVFTPYTSLTSRDPRNSACYPPKARYNPRKSARTTFLRRPMQPAMYYSIRTRSKTWPWSGLTRCGSRTPLTSASMPSLSTWPW